MAVTAKHSAGRAKPYSRFMSQIAEENREVMDRRKQAVLDRTAKEDENMASRLSKLLTDGERANENMEHVRERVANIARKKQPQKSKSPTLSDWVAENATKKKIPDSQLRAMGSTNRKNLIPVNGVKQAASRQSTINRNRQTEERIGTKANRTRREIEDAYIEAVRKKRRQER